jgi:hypothetical protein
MARYAGTACSHPRGTRLTTGNALIARLATSAFAHGTTCGCAAKPWS